MAGYPKQMMRFFRKGTGTISAEEPETFFLISCHQKNTNNKKAMLQINVNFDKNLITLI